MGERRRAVATGTCGSAGTVPGASPGRGMLYLMLHNRTFMLAVVYKNAKLLLFTAENQ
jgi:hypothetical protein